MVGLERLKFLIIDDNYHMLNIISTVLRGFAAKDFIETTDPTEALKVLQSHRIDIVIVDYNMSGWRRLRPPGAEQPREPEPLYPDHHADSTHRTPPCDVGA